MSMIKDFTRVRREDLAAYKIGSIAAVVKAMGPPLAGKFGDSSPAEVSELTAKVRENKALMVAMVNMLSNYYVNSCVKTPFDISSLRSDGDSLIIRPNKVSVVKGSEIVAEVKSVYGTLMLAKDSREVKVVESIALISQELASDVKVKNGKVVHSSRQSTPTFKHTLNQAQMAQSAYIVEGMAWDEKSSYGGHALANKIYTAVSAKSQDQVKYIIGSTTDYDPKYIQENSDYGTLTYQLADKDGKMATEKSMVRIKGKSIAVPKKPMAVADIVPLVTQAKTAMGAVKSGMGSSAMDFYYGAPIDGNLKKYLPILQAARAYPPAQAYLIDSSDAVLAGFLWMNLSKKPVGFYSDNPMSERDRTIAIKENRVFSYKKYSGLPSCVLLVTTRPSFLVKDTPLQTINNARIAFSNFVTQHPVYGIEHIIPIWHCPIQALAPYLGVLSDAAFFQLDDPSLRVRDTDRQTAEMFLQMAEVNVKKGGAEFFPTLGLEIHKLFVPISSMPPVRKLNSMEFNYALKTYFTNIQVYRYNKKCFYDILLMKKLNHIMDEELRFSFFSLKAAKKLGIDLDVDLLAGDEMLSDFESAKASLNKPFKDPIPKLDQIVGSKKNFNKKNAREYVEKQKDREKAAPKEMPEVGLEMEVDMD